MSDKGWASLQSGWGIEALAGENADHWLVRAGLASSVQDACNRWKRELPRGGRLLDVGCGNQPYRPWVEQSGLTYYGIDRCLDDSYSSTIIDWDLMQIPWPFDDASFDALLCTEVIEHVPDPLLLLRECARVCRAGSVLALTAPFVWPEHEAPHDYHRFTRYGLQMLVERSGFRVEAVWARGSWSGTVSQLLGFASVHQTCGWRSRLAKLLVRPTRLLLNCLDASTADAAFSLPLGFSLVARLPDAVRSAEYADRLSAAIEPAH